LFQQDFSASQSSNLLDRTKKRKKEENHMHGSGEEQVYADDIRDLRESSSMGSVQMRGAGVMLFLLTAVPSTLHIVPDAGIFRMNK
jgi:hypothetical protein